MMESNESKARVVILTGSYQIKGLIDILPGARVTDLMNGGKDFLAVTDASVYELGDSMHHILSAPFLNVSREHIQVIAPL